MSKDSLQINQINGKNLGFNEFWQMIASELGNSRLKINSQAKSIKYFLDASSDHKEFLRNLIHQSYKRCHCYHLNARFDVNIALDILGETSYSLQGSKEDDLLDIELLEEIAWLIDQHFSTLIETPKSLLSSNYQLVSHSKQASSERDTLTARGTSVPSSVVSLSNLKIRKANLQL